MFIAELYVLWFLLLSVSYITLPVVSLFFSFVSFFFFFLYTIHYPFWHTCRHLIMYVLSIQFKMVFGVVIIFIAKGCKVVLQWVIRIQFHLVLSTERAIKWELYTYYTGCPSRNYLVRQEGNYCTLNYGQMCVVPTCYTVSCALFVWQMPVIK